MDKELFRQTAEACKMVTEHFGLDVIADQKRFCSAFSDFAPKLSKEKKAFNLALSENVGAFFLREHENVTSGKKSADSIIKRAVTDLSDYLNEEKAELVVKSLAYALGWEFTSAEPEKEVESSDISAFSSGSTLIEELFSKARNGDNDACFNLGDKALCFVISNHISLCHKAVKIFTVGSFSAINPFNPSIINSCSLVT